MSNLPSNQPKRFSRLRIIEQISEHHCGPAVIEMLLENLGVELTQEQITEAAGAAMTIADHGTRVDQLAKAVNDLAPLARLWYKEKANLADLQYVLEEAKYPVGVEWQGIFDDDPEDLDDDYGHYSVIAHIDEAQDELIIMDPYKDFVEQSRIIKIRIFLKRWWDYNEVIDPDTRKKVFKKDEELFFVVVPRDVTFPEGLGMRAYY
ncbi:MAG: cysteine peptidase family C39 domain-containing protein [Anaerolineae bacterium]